MDQNGFDFNDTVGGFTESKSYESVGGFGEYEDTINKAVGSFTDAGVSRYEAPEPETVKPKRDNLPFVTIFLVLAILAVALFNLITDETHVDIVGLNYVYIKHYHEFGRMLVSMFLHTNTKYMLGNVVALAIIGSELEKRIGSLRMLIIYLVSGIGANGVAVVVSMIFKNHQASYYYGASGAIFGILCAYFITYKKKDKESKIADLIAIIVLSVFFAVITFLYGSVELATNIAGIILGGGLALLLQIRKKTGKEKLVFKLVGVALCLAICCFSVVQAKSDRYAKRFIDPRVDIAKNTEIVVYGERMYATYGEALDHYCTDTSWKGFHATDGSHVVEFRGTISSDDGDGSILIQFLLNDNWSECNDGYFEINGKRVKSSQRNAFFENAARSYLLNSNE